MAGYDLNLARLVRDAIGLPFTMIGGASSLEDMSDLIREVGVVGGCRQCICFQRPVQGGLITYERPWVSSMHRTLCAGFVKALVNTIF